MIALGDIRNVAIIAHIDHGKSTLADRLIEATGTLSSRVMKEQVLDTLDLERERGITIKLQPVQMSHRQDGKQFTINLIDTPGHVDFSYEVNRTLAAVEGVLLLVDASQGIEAQTIAHIEQAISRNLTIIPVINKIDLPNADPERVIAEMVKILGVNKEEVIAVSAKEGTNVESVLRAIVDRIPAPTGDPAGVARGLVFDSFFDSYRGVVAYVRVIDGTFMRDEEVTLLGSQAKAIITGVGVFKPKRELAKELSAGLTGYIETGLKEIREVRVGDTISASGGQAEALPGYEPSEPKVYAAMFPTDPDRYPILRSSLERLALNDASLLFEPMRSMALGAGFRVGFLGLLHMEIIQERLRREFELEIISTTPSVPYKLMKNGKEIKSIQGPADLPDNMSGDVVIKEPWTKVEIVSPTEYIGAILQLIPNRRGQLTGQEYLDPTRVIIRADMPLAEVIIGFFDRLKSVTRGYASLHYEIVDYRAGDLARLDVLIANEPVEALAMIVPREKAEQVGRKLTKRLKELVPPQQFAVPIQAAIGGKIVARETLSARRKDVTAKLYGGDVTRKRKLLEKQKAGKKKMQSMGRVSLPSDAYYKLMRTDFYER